MSSKIAIETCLTLRAVFRSSLRAAQGFVSSLISMMKLDLDTPTYSCLCKRSAELAVRCRLKIKDIYGRSSYVFQTFPQLLSQVVSKNQRHAFEVSTSLHRKSTDIDGCLPNFSFLQF
ncbi:transposase [Pseudoalteromonas sp. McH1-42]|uniref:transposase n=1 Tax=Pseudoalteromonas sp. McH1-42 TaxID=2917752 RepID=UPI001EF5614E|nr:transposase [Pseudoalteromonas sp. McH1-42]